jgi:wobble nucleotide-excising tRNase
VEEKLKDKIKKLFKLKVNNDNKFKVKIDKKVINEGNLMDDFKKNVNKKNEIDDNEEKKN